MLSQLLYTLLRAAIRTLDRKKCESLFARAACKPRGQHELHAHSSAVGSTATVVGKLFQLRNHNDTGGRTVQVLPMETQVHWANETSKNYN